MKARDELQFDQIQLVDDEMTAGAIIEGQGAARSEFGSADKQSVVRCNFRLLFGRQQQDEELVAVGGWDIVQDGADSKDEISDGFVFG